MDGSINSSREIRDFKEFYFGPDHICYDVRLALPLLLFLVTL